MVDLLASGRYTSAQLAQQFNVHVRTVQRDLVLLQTEPIYLPLIVDEYGRYGVMEGYRRAHRN